MIAEALAAACPDPAVLAHLAGPLGEAARAAHATLQLRSGDARRAQRAAWCANVRAPVPPGLRGVDPSWIEAALAELPAAARTAVAAPASTPSAIWLARWACAGIPPLPPIDPQRDTPGAPADVIRLAPARLVAWLVEVGADQLAFALGAQAAQAAAVFGDPVRRAAARIDRSPRSGELGPRRRAIERARIEPGPHALARIGARTIAPHLDPVARRQVAVRCRRDLGLDPELARFAGIAVADTASWRALGASGT